MTMRELTMNEIDMVSGGNDGHDTSGHTPQQKAAEKAAEAVTGVEMHCEKVGDSTYSCSPVGG